MKMLMRSKNLKIKFVEESDAQFILDLRNNKELGKYLSSTSSSLENQKEWINNYKKREKNGEEYYFKAYNDNSDIGFFRLYNIDNTKKELTFGSFIMKVDRPKYAAIESMILAMEFAFKTLNMDKVLLDVRINNERAKNFYNRFGFIKINEDEIDEFYELTKENYKVLFEEKYKEFL